MKKFLVILSILLLVGLVAFFCRSRPLSHQINVSSNEDSQCAFCNPSVVNYQKFYESETILGLFNYRPLMQGHVLIIPRRHVERLEDLHPEEFVAIAGAIKKIHKAFNQAYKKNDYLLVLQNGKDGGQTVPHVHFHMIPRGSDWTSLIKANLWLSFLTDVTGLSSPVSAAEMKSQTDILKNAMNEF